MSRGYSSSLLDPRRASRTLKGQLQASRDGKGRTVLPKVPVWCALASDPVQLGVPSDNRMLTNDFQCLLMYAKRSNLPTLFNSGVKISPPFQAGTGVPSGLPVVVLGEGRGSYCRLRSQYWPAVSASP